MDQSRPSLEHRQKRRTLWAKLWLARIVTLLAACAHLPLPGAARDLLNHVLTMLTKLVTYLVLIRAGQLQPAGVKMRNPRQEILARTRHDVRIKGRGARHRAVIGGRLRRALKVSGAARKSFQARAEKILSVLNALETFAARTARRLRKGSTRRLALHTGVALSLLIQNLASLCAQAGLFSLTPELAVARAPP
jgi:hypothetical protein